MNDLASDSQLNGQNYVKYRCLYCSKILSSKQNLKEHQYIHSGEKPYVCCESRCNMRFRQGSQLSAHKRIHVAIKNHLEKPDIASLKVNNIQLTSLINGIDIMDTNHFYSNKDEKQDKICVPLIEGPQSFSALPKSI